MRRASFQRLDDDDEVLADAQAEVAASVDWLRTSLKALEAPLPPAAVEKTLAFCSERLGVAQRDLREFEVELQASTFRGSSSAKITSAQADFQKQSLALQRLRGTYEFHKAQRERERLLALPGAGAGSSSQTGGSSSEKLTPSQIIDAASAIQDKSKAAVRRMSDMVQDAKQVGSATAAELGEQRVKLEQVNAQVSGLAATVAQAEREAARYAKGMFDDCLQLVLLVLVVVGLIFVGIMQLSQLGDDPSQIDERHHLQTDLVTVYDETADRGPWNSYD